MDIKNKNISIISNSSILFSHVKDIPYSSSHTFHLHDYIEIYIYVSGDVSFIINDKYIKLKTGNIILVDENIIHKPVINSQNTYERYYIGIPRNSFSFITNGKSPIDFINRKKQIINLSDTEYHTALAFLNNISRNAEINPSDIYVQFSYLLQFLKIINTACEKSNANTDFIKSETPLLVTQVLNFIENAPNVCGSVKEIADIFHVNSSYLSTIFSKSTHVTLKQYLSYKKISTAKNMLLSDEPLSQIAYDCGFSSCSHFISVFKKSTGKTPKEYRKENK